MGWDAYAVAPSGLALVNVNIADPGPYQHMLKDFRNAANDLRNKGIGCDGLLPEGGLDCSDCGDMLNKATNISVYEDWPDNKVLAASLLADWSFAINGDQMWAYWSAKVFLEICAKYRLSIHFSY